MEIFLVYHKINPDFWSEPDVVPATDLEYVATVHANDLNGVYRATNNIDMDWQLNPEILKTADKKSFRSTSVGDVIVAIPHNWIADDIKVYLVARCGFKEIKISTKEVPSVQEMD